MEIGLLAAVLYFCYLHLRGTRGANILIAILMVYLGLTLLSHFLDLVVIGWLLRSLSIFLALSLVIIFQPEIRRVLAELGSHRIFSTTGQKRETIDQIVDTVIELSNKQRGALIALERETGLHIYAETGVPLDSELSRELVCTIFSPKTELHDGGLIVRNDRIVAAGCIFPVSQRESLDRSMGLRHRAGLGLSEESDAVTIVVSEETGAISLCHQGRIEHNLEFEEFKRRLNQVLLPEEYDPDVEEKLDGKNHGLDSGHHDLVSDSKQRREDSISS